MGDIDNDLNNLKIDQPIFKDVHFFLKGNVGQKIEEILCKHGGTKMNYISDFVTHYIYGDDVDDTTIFDAEYTYDLTAVNCNWVKACISLNKLVNTKPYRKSNNKLFASLVFCIAQTSKKDLKSLWTLIKYYGGKVKLNVDSKCTHLICGAAKGTRYTMCMSLASEKLTIVTPDWILDSIKEKTLCPTNIYHPRLLITNNDSINSESENGLRKITGFDFEESLAKTEVPTQVSGPKDDILKATFDKPKQKPLWNTTESSSLQSPVNKSPVSSQGLSLLTTQSNLSFTNNTNSKFTSAPINNQNVQIHNQRLQQQHQQIHNNQPVLLNQNAISQQQTASKSNLNHQKVQLGNNTAQNQQNDEIDWKASIVSNNLGGKILGSTQQIVVSTGQNQMQLNNVQQLHQKQSMNINISNQMAVTQSGGQVITQNVQHLGLNQQQTIVNNQQIINKQQLPNQHIINNTQINQNLNLNNQQMADLQNQQILIQQQNKAMNNQLQINNQQIQLSQHNNLHQISNQHIITTSQQPNQLNSSPINQQMINQQQAQQIFKAQQTIQNQQIINQQTMQNPQLINMQQNQQVINQQMMNQNSIINNQRVEPQVLNQQNIQILGQQQQNVQNPQMLQQSNQSNVINQQQNPQVWQHQQQYAITNVQQQQQQRQPTPRAIWQQQVGQPGQPQRQLIHLDAHTHAQLQQMDPQQRAQFIAHLQKQQRALMQKQQQQAGLVQRPGAPPRPTQIAVIRSQVPAGLTPQQQIQWVQQQQQGVVRPPQQVAGGVVVAGAPGLSPISQQQQPQTAFALDPNAANQQHMQQLQIQRQQQYQRLKQLQMQREQAQKQAGAGMTLVSNNVLRGQPAAAVQGFVSETEAVQPSVVVAVDQQQNQPQPPPQAVVVNSKTKTALANMLSNRLQSGCNTVAVPGADQEPSAAGTLRLMTAQHNASLNAPVAPRTQQELLVLQQQRRAGIGAAPVAMPGAAGAGQVAVMPGGATAGQVAVMPGAGGVLGQTNGTTIKPPGMVYANGRLQMQPARPQFYGHNPNLKLPPDLFLLGCIFLIVEYDEEMPEEVTLWKKIISQHGGEVEPSYCTRVTHLLCKTQRHGLVMQAIRDVKRCVTAYWLSDTVLKRQVLPPWQAIHLPAFGTQRPAYKHIVSYSGFEGDERIRVREMIEETGAKFTGYLSKHNTVLVCKRPEGRKYKYARDRGMNVVNVAWLSDILLGNLDALKQFDSPKYQQYNTQTLFRLDYALVPHLMAGWKSPINITQESHERVKRSLSPHASAPRPKKPCPSTLSPSNDQEKEDGPVQVISKNLPSEEEAPRVLFSFSGEKLSSYIKIVKQLGGRVVESPSDATHLVLGLPYRTRKLLMCLIVSQYIVTPQWLIESEQSKEFLPCEKYTVRDEGFYNTYKCDIEKVLLKTNRNELFKNKIFFLTYTLQPSRTLLRELIEASGGIVEKVRRSCTQVQELQNVNPNGYVVITAFADLHLVIDLVRSTKITKCVCNTEFVMSSIMTQEINFEPYVVTIN